MKTVDLLLRQSRHPRLTTVVAGNVLLVLLMSHAVLHISEIQLITSSQKLVQSAHG